MQGALHLNAAPAVWYSATNYACSRPGPATSQSGPRSMGCLHRQCHGKRTNAVKHGTLADLHAHRPAPDLACCAANTNSARLAANT